MSEDDRDRENTLRRRAWDRDADTYDRRMGGMERRLLGADHRAWACERATGAVLELAVGTGLNFVHYAPGTSLVGIDLSPGMLALARARARELGLEVDLREDDAHDLDLPDATFDTVLCTYSLCNVPDLERTLHEAHRVLRPGGRLVLVDHVRSTVRPLRWLQRAIELVSVRLDGDRMTRRPAESLARHGFAIAEQERFRAGIVERLTAVRT